MGAIRIGKRVIGKVQNEVFIKSAHRSKHFLREPAGIAFDVNTLVAALNEGAVSIEVREQETGCIYRASLLRVLNDGERINRGHGNQRLLTLDKWQVERPVVQGVLL